MSMTLQDAMLNAAREPIRLTIEQSIERNRARCSKTLEHLGAECKACPTCKDTGFLPVPLGRPIFENPCHCVPNLNPIQVRELMIRLRHAEDRIFDLLLGDDGQAYDEAEKYLDRHRPDLLERLNA